MLGSMPVQSGLLKLMKFAAPKGGKRHAATLKLDDFSTRRKPIKIPQFFEVFVREEIHDRKG